MQGSKHITTSNSFSLQDLQKKAQEIINEDIHLSGRSMHMHMHVHVSTPHSSVMNRPVRPSTIENGIFSDGFQWRFLWLMNQLFICFWSNPVDLASAILSPSWKINHKHGFVWHVSLVVSSLIAVKQRFSYIHRHYIF